jgi:adenylate cyclase
MSTQPKDAEGVTEEGARIPMPAISEIIDWLAGHECHELDATKLAAELGCRLRTTGLPLDHLVLYLRTLHPEIRGRTIAWAPGEPVQTHDRQHGVELSSAFLNNPVRRVLETQEPVCYARRPA